MDGMVELTKVDKVVQIVTKVIETSKIDPIVENDERINDVKVVRN